MQVKSFLIPNLHNAGFEASGLTESARDLSIAAVMELSIIIPVLNELENLPITIAHLQAGLPKSEIIVVDGGSRDGTREWLAKQTDLAVLDAERGRGCQMRVGASQATGNVLLFLHADCTLPANAYDCIKQVLQNPAVIGGAFVIQFAEAFPRSLPLIAKGINARTRVTKTATGDQGIFVRRKVYESVGGFEGWPLFEDVNLVSKVKQHGKFVIIREPIVISGRRYIANGPWLTTFLMYALRIGYWAGIHPNRLYQWFADIRPHLQKRAGDSLS